MTAEADAALVERIRAGDAAAEAELVERYRPGVLLLCRHRAGPDLAEDLCQETLRIALENLRSGSLREAPRLSAYLWGIAVNLERREHRRNRRERPTGEGDLEHLTDPQPPADERVLRGERARLVRSVLSRLADRDRELLRAFYLEDATKDEVCRRMHLRPSQFDVVKFRALERFARAFDLLAGRGDRNGARPAHALEERVRAKDAT